MSRWIGRILIFGILLAPLIAFLVWLVAPARPINALILDKTVLFNTGPEHRSFNWILTHNKYKKKDDGRFYQIEDDYYGFFPIERGRDSAWEIHDFNHWNQDALDSLADELDMIFYTDLYGIYVNEWFRDTTLWKERSRKIYGGLTQKEVDLLKKMKDRQKLILTEFNLFGSPTPAYIRNQAEELLNVKWTKWTGRYFDLLDTAKNEELPRWVVNNYMKQHGYVWPFTKAGIVFAREDDHIEILEAETHLEVEVPFIYSSKYGRKKFNLPKKVHYPFWFDITLPSNDSNTVVSNFQIEPNLKGDSIMNLWNIPKVFPALMEHTGPSPYYYFCADFTDNPIDFFSAYFAGCGLVNSFYWDNEYVKRKKFFWKYYRPLLNRIMRKYYREIR